MELINQVIDHIIASREIIRVDDVVSQLNISKRTLQRMFRQYVGFSPKWVIKRYRLHEAAKQVAEGGAVNWSKLALDLGYFDQTHFIKDFKRIWRNPSYEINIVTLHKIAQPLGVPTSALIEDVEEQEGLSC